MSESFNLDKSQIVPLNGDVTAVSEQRKEIKFFRRKTCLLSRNHILIFSLFFLLILLVSILVTVFIMKSSHNRSRPTCPSEIKDTETDARNVTTLIPDHISKHSNNTLNKFRLPPNLKPHKYDITLVIDLKRFLFNGSVSIEISAQSSTSFVIVNVHELSVNAQNITVTELYTQRSIGISRTYLWPENNFYFIELREDLVEKRSYIVRFGYFAGKIERDLHGIYLSSYETADGETRYLATSQLQSTFAREVFPCFDEPQLKAEFAVTIIHQEGLKALSNTRALTSEPYKDGWVKDEFQSTPVMSSYLLAFVVSDMIHEEAYVDNLRIRLWSRPSTENQTKFALEYVLKTYKYFTDYFAIPEVMAKVDHVAVPDFSSGAMENWGLIIYRETSILYDPVVSSSFNKYMITLIVAHEIVHTWFGNMVTMKWWTDLWLNEGFASTLMFFAMDHAYPDWNVHDIQIVEDIFHVMIQDALLSSHPVSVPIDHPDQIIQFFDKISYNKGMAILKMLLGFLGWNDFQQGLRNYIKRYKFDNAEMAELWQVFTETVHERYDVAGIMDTWTLQMGYPVITVKTNRSHYLLHQERFLLNPTDVYNRSESEFGYMWYIPFKYKTQTDGNVTHLHWLSTKSSNIPRVSDGWMLGNVDVYGFYLVNYEDEMWRKFAVQLNSNHKVFSQANRAGLINNALLLARAGQLHYNLALNITTYLRTDVNYVPWKAFLDSIEFLGGMLSTSPVYGLFQEYIRRLVAPVFDIVGVNPSQSPLPTKYMQWLILNLGCSVEVSKTVNIAQEMFNDWMQHGKRIPVDFSAIVYQVGIRQGGTVEWEFLWNKSVETNVATERESMRGALAHTQRSWLLWRYMSWVLDETKIRLQDLKGVIDAMSSTPVSRMILRQFIMNNWQRLLKLYENNWFGLKEIIPAFTKYINTEFEYKQLSQLFSDHPPPAASESANSALALVRANIHWMKTSYPAVADWLRSHIRD